VEHEVADAKPAATEKATAKLERIALAVDVNYMDLLISLDGSRIWCAEPSRVYNKYNLTIYYIYE
jgi:hypothetical protein